ncbi:uncharacterized protein LOC115217703 [Octopus sinensis]|uniref:Uncharacterized protein LOC115217703 n=1 Tax=Octopus sinensis TaxID=2607531 RepID=A0A6P7SY61_9MOLL|nr:uncharacterized protein LOC115217703 [Octopus sinensis]
MAVGFKYASMTITGAIHFTLGILCLCISIVGFSIDIYRRRYFSRDMDKSNYLVNHVAKVTAAGSFIASLYVIAVGIVGIFTGQVSNSEAKTRKMIKIYLILTVLSASLFAIGGITAFVMISLFATDSTNDFMSILFFFGVFLMVLEFIFAIISSSICCCCSGIKKNAVTTQRQEVLVQSTERNVLPAVYPPNVYPLNVYPPNVYPPNVYPPNVYPRNVYPLNVAGEATPSSNSQ